jgi:hypothetical protein
MKIQFRTSRFITGVTVVCALAIATTAFAKNPKAVSLEIIRIGSDDQLTITTKPGANDCDVSSRQDKGCIEFKRKEKKSDIIFQLKGDTKCRLDSGTDWKLNAVYLGGFNSSSKPSKDDFGFDNTPDPDYEKVNSDFGIANRTSGLVTSVKGPDKKKITINDKNKSKFNVWYKIEAICEREDGKPAHTRSSDPRVKNGGTE